MKNPRCHFGCIFLALAVLFIFTLFSPANSQASVTMNVSIDQFGSPSQNNVSYGIFIGLSTTDVPITYYEVYSSHTNSFAGVGTGSTFNVLSLPDFNSLLNELTNGNWKLVENVGDPSEKTYLFKPILTGFTTNLFPFNQILNPPYNAVNVVTNPVFAFVGPSNYQSFSVGLDKGNNGVDGASLPSNATNWLPNVALDFGSDYDFFVQYSTDASSHVSFPTPTTTNSQALSGWSNSVVLYIQDDSNFTTTNAPPSNGGHNLAAHYPFDASSFGPFDSAFLSDTSGHGLNIPNPSTSDGNYPQPTAISVAGSSGVQFDGSNWYYMPTNLLPVIVGSCTISLWLNTTQASASDTDPGYQDPAIVWAGGIGSTTFDSEPMTLTGNKLGYFTGANDFDTLHSETSINSGSFTHIVVTRDATTGHKQIFINGILDASDTVDPEILSDSTQLVLGESLFHGGVAGVVDDVQFYSGVLSPVEVLSLYNNPGTTVPDVIGISLQTALDATNLTWATSGDAQWFGEASVTQDGISAAQSGVLFDNQMSVLQTTVNGPGTISFYWQTLGDSDNFDLEFDDGGFVADISSQTPWSQYTHRIGTGLHTLTWTAFSKDSSSTNDTGYVDQVVYTPDLFPPPTLGTWSKTGSLLSPVGEFTLSVLGNGNVLAAGGLLGGFPEVSASEANLYIPATGKWTNTTPMNVDRRLHSATILPGGKVLVAGGFSGTLGNPGIGTNASAEIYDPAGQTWTNTAPMHTARGGHAAALLNNGLVIVAGGIGGGVTSELFNPATQSWTNTGSLNEARINASAFTLSNNKVLIVGGAGDNTAELYDPTTGHWTLAKPMLMKQDGATATLLTNGTVLTAGGVDENGDTTAFSEFYDPATGNWTQSGTMNMARSGAAAVLLNNGIVLVAGGAGTGNGTLTNAELYSPVSGQWTQTGAMLESRNDFVSVLLQDKRVLAAGGFLSTAELYATAGSTQSPTIVLSNLIVLPNGAFQFSWTNIPGSTNIVLSSTNAATQFNGWLQLGAGIEISPGHFRYTNSPGNLKQNFYRVRSP